MGRTTKSPKGCSGGKPRIVVIRKGYGSDDCFGINIEKLKWCKKPETLFPTRALKQGEIPVT